MFLLDEPLSNLDAKLRVQTRAEISKLHQRLGTTFIYVTHDQIEAMSMADKIAVMYCGQLYQWGTPDEIYNQPVNAFVARFIGGQRPLGLFDTHAGLRGAAPGHGVLRLGVGERGFGGGPGGHGMGRGSGPGMGEGLGAGAGFGANSETSSGRSGARNPLTPPGTLFCETK